MKMNRKLLPIKAHYFFFMAAMGPILPQLSVYGKELGISPVIMGTITGILPFAFLLAKPSFGLLVDVYREHRKRLFLGIVILMSGCYSMLYLIPARTLAVYRFEKSGDACNVTGRDYCSNFQKVTCDNLTHSESLLVNKNLGILCPGDFLDFHNVTCRENVEIDPECTYTQWNFWLFLVLMSLGTVAFNVANSVSDAICFDVIGDDYDYGKQRVWGTVGFGLTALLSGWIVDLSSGDAITYAPAFLLMIVFTLFDLVACAKLKLPVIERPRNIFKDLKELLNNRHTVTFVCFAVLAGILDGFIVYFLFWYLEDLAARTGTENVKLVEGLIVAAETLGGEVLFFSIAGRILARFGHSVCFTMCFIFYALRLALVSVAPNPWWIIPVEFALQGPTYALTYTTIVEYANDIAPPGASATMQGIAAGMDDGFGFAIGSITGGLLYKYIGGSETFQIFALLGLVSSLSHVILHKTVLRRHEAPNAKNKSDQTYKPPGEMEETELVLLS